MKILLNPQVRENSKIWYKVEHQKITATINGISDTFDFTDMPNGELSLWDDEGNDLAETVLDEIPIRGAKKENGTLSVKILFTIDMDEKDERLLFPDWMNLEEFNNLMDEISERDKEGDESGEDGVEE